MNLMISMPGGAEWLILIFTFLFLLFIIPFLCYRMGYRAGKRDGELEARRRNSNG